MEKKIFEKIKECVLRHKEVRLFILFGSRAQGMAREDSDWDFGYIAAQGFDSMPLYTELVLILDTDHIDLVDLARANGLLRFRAIKDGIELYENPKGEYQKLWLEVVHFWCDASPIIREEYDGILEGLG
jgi:uncharacterized protein